MATPSSTFIVDHAHGVRASVFLEDPRNIFTFDHAHRANRTPRRDMMRAYLMDIIQLSALTQAYSTINDEYRKNLKIQLHKKKH